MFAVRHKDTDTMARTGRLSLPHGELSTPVFMPVGTNATVKALTNGELCEIGFEIILSNTYHLYLRPGTDVIGAAGGLHDFSGWKRNYLTDSGGFQIFSLSSLRKISDEGVRFRSHIDGSEHLLSPEKVVDIQALLGSDIQMQLDVCTSYDTPYNKALTALQTNNLWLRRAKQRWLEQRDAGYRGLFFAIVQGNFYKDLRERSAEAVTGAYPSGIAIGGLSVGEPREVFAEYLSFTGGLLPDDKPRYVMGIGTPDYILLAIENGIDMFDCVLPTRLARNGQALTHSGPLSLKKQERAFDLSPIDSACSCKVCKKYSRAYLRHLFKAGEILFPMLVSYHNLYFLHDLIKKARLAIEADRFTVYKEEFLKTYYGGIEAN
ncbi:MAG: tRNA guanosine(34) transglycosylase Tgt [Spirochaetaceae bacterium]|jgi:queuine tRNA-ribosyltransferase|nr:tRNA guanosine(34) transglycosylase Tgt [Spirochaetaceae bacterium]